MSITESLFSFLESKSFGRNLWNFNASIFQHMCGDNPGNTEIFLHLKLIHLFNFLFFSGNNIFFSPLSISAALSMALLGAREKTAFEVLQAFGLQKEEEEQWHSFLKSVAGFQDSGCPMQCATKMFVEKSFSVLPSFSEQLQRFYDVEHGSV